MYTYCDIYITRINTCKQYTNIELIFSTIYLITDLLVTFFIKAK